MSVSRAVSEIFSVKEWRDLETEGRGRSKLEVTEGHSEWYHSKGWVRFPIRLP